MPGALSTLILGGLADTVGADLVDRVVYEDSQSVGVMAVNRDFSRWKKSLRD